MGLKNSKNMNGMTLIEIIIAMALLGIILISFLNLFGAGFTSIFEMGQKSDAASDIQSIMEIIYRDGNTDHLDYLVTLSQVVEVVNYNDLFNQYTSGPEIRFHVGSITLLSGATVEQVTLVKFYQKGKRHVTLSSALPN